MILVLAAWLVALALALAGAGVVLMFVWRVRQ